MLSQNRSVAAARSTRAAASPLQQTAETAAAFSPEGVNPQRLLEGEIQAATEHSEVISRPVDYAEAQIVSPTKVTGDSEFETCAELAEHFGFTPEVIRLGMDLKRVGRPLRVKDVSFATAENRTDASPSVRRKTRARDWITQCESA